MSAQAANSAGASDGPQGSLWLGVAGASFGLLCLLSAAGTWIWARGAARQRDQAIARLKEESAKRLEREIAEREAAQQALQEKQEFILRQERLAAVGEMTAGLAHEFNNILTIIQGHASLLLDEPNMSEDAIKSVTHITDGVERTAALVKQMLAFSRKQVMQLKVFQIQETFNQVRDMLTRLLGAHVVLRVDIPPQLTPIKADPDMLQQILCNLAVNAREAMRSGGQFTILAEEVQFSAADVAGRPDRKVGRFVRICLEDTGSGIDPKTIPHIFEPFYTTKEVGKGAGLGLATVHGMVTQNGGWIEVESAIGVGTTFQIYLPAAEAPPKRVAETILVVEDETVLRELVREILETVGYQVLDAASGQEALQVWQKHRGDVRLLLTDMSMPDGMSGRELAARLQKDNPRLPVIFSSGYSQEQLEETELTGPGQKFLSKPYQPEDLAQAVRSCLNSAAPAPNA